MRKNSLNKRDTTARATCTAIYKVNRRFTCVKDKNDKYDEGGKTHRRVVW